MVLMVSVNVSIFRRITPLCRTKPPSIIPRYLYSVYCFGVGWYCRGMIIGRRRDRAKASAACWEIGSERIMLPIDMKKLSVGMSIGAV
jgi:hypothetical protein